MTEFETKLKLAAKAVGQGKLSRRDFIQFAMAAGFTAAAANTMFATAARAEPKKGGTFKLGTGHGATTDTLDPATWTNGLQFDMAVGVFGAMLTSIDQKTAVQPHLAESSSRSTAPSNGYSSCARADLPQWQDGDRH
jgi:peptide/nickel transport system substrate-binding protein